MKDVEQKTLAQLEAELIDSEKIYLEAVDQKNNAERHLTDCRNRLNDKQRQLDKKMNEIKGRAPCGTDWTQKQGLQS